ncbi:MAG: hypothetical protein ACI4RB_04045 [Acutalibacteraceae bacterium]
MNKNDNKTKKLLGAILFGLLAAAAVLFVGFYFCFVPLNVHSASIWVLAALAVFAFIFAMRLALGIKDFYRANVSNEKHSKKGKKYKTTKNKFKFNLKPYIFPIIIISAVIVIAVFGSTVFYATDYASILTVKDAQFSDDMDESVGTDSIALMDTASAKMLGDREIGSLSSVVSQFNVSDDYIQIDLNGKPIKVSALEYAGFFKWKNNNSEGIRGYVTVDPVSMSAKFNECDGMKYVPSAYFSEDAHRHMWSKYPTELIGNIHFEVDENGKPYYVASVYQKTISLFGGKTVIGCIIMDPVTGEMQKYDVADIPQWVDVVFDGNLICVQYNWFGTLKNGYFNSIIGKKGCKQVTEYYSEEAEDDAPASDYGYVSKDGDIWIYTGVTSVNGDSSNIGFVLANERTGECHYYSIAGADEKSAMVAAEGEVQEKGYQASFPSLININGNPTYIMVLKDAGGLVKLYAAVNVEQYNLVTTATTQAECIAKYKALIGAEQPEPKPDETKTVTITVADVKYIDIDGNTYIYLISGGGEMYKAKAAAHEDMLLIKAGDKVELTCSGSSVLTCVKK